MPSSYTPLLRLTLPADGELVGTWGQTVNNGITSLEEAAIAGTVAVPVTDGADTVLTIANGAADQARFNTLFLTGALTAQRNVICPAASKNYFVRNATTGGFGVQVKTAAGAGVVVPAGQAMLLYCDGGSVTQAVTSPGAITVTDINGTPDLILKASGNEGARLLGSTLSFGIGRSDPVYKLDVLGPVGNGIRYSSPSVGLVMTDAGGNFGLMGTSTNTPLVFITNSVECARLLPNGNLGINNQSPATALDVGGTIRSMQDLPNGGSGVAIKNSSVANNITKYSALLFQGADTVGNEKPTGMIAVGPDQGDYVGAYMSFFTRSADATFERMRIVSGGSIGINIGTPARSITTTPANSPILAIKGSITLPYGLGGDEPFRIGEWTTINYAENTNSVGGAVGFNISPWNATANGTTVLQAGIDVGFGGIDLQARRSNLSVVHRLASFHLGQSVFYTGNQERMRITGDGNVGIGESNPDTTYARTFIVSAQTGAYVQCGLYAKHGADLSIKSTTTGLHVCSYSGDSEDGGNNRMLLRVLNTVDNVNTERMRIAMNGHVGIGNQAPTYRLVVDGQNNGNIINVGNITGVSFVCQSGTTSLQGWSGTEAKMHVASSNTTSRSINASGTVNQNGADYAEYERNGGQVFAKGDVVGFDADGVLTHDFAAAVRFGVKSTDPGLVGGDTWGSEEALGMRHPGHEDAEALAVFEAKLEEARQFVDRVSYSGKVPVNVWGATPGGYIVADVGADGCITGVFVASADFEQYKRAVGRVNRILGDGRAEVAVIVH